MNASQQTTKQVNMNSKGSDDFINVAIRTRISKETRNRIDRIKSAFGYHSDAAVMQTILLEGLAAMETRHKFILRKP